MKRAVLTILIAVFSVGLLACGDDEKPFGGVVTRKHSAATPGGARVYSPKEISPAKLAAIDEGLSDLFAIAGAPPYEFRNFMSWANYTIDLYPRSPKCQNPAFTVSYAAGAGDPYDQSKWDKDPQPGRVEMCVAGQVTDLILGSMVVVDDLGTLRTIVRYEGEHLILYYNDRELFWKTVYHTGDTGHPILNSPGIRAPVLDGRFYYAELRIGGERMGALLVE